MYNDAFIEEVRSRSDIVDVVGERVHLERKGANYFGCCPFHNEKTPSFSVHQGKQIFHCFGCGEGGNVFTFLMKYEGITFPEAVRALAERAGMQVPDDDLSPAEAQQRRSRKERLLAINKEAALYYYRRLHEPEGQRGMEYFTGRGLSAETMRRFGLGFADIGGNKLAEHLRAAGYTDAQIIKAGLAANDEKRGLYDKFWNRVMFPIFDIGNHVIGFGGRVLGDAKPKYLNSPETPIFDKGRNLYGLNYAKNARTGNVILCEGYMDVIAMHQAGFSQALASLGTALTENQAGLLKRYAKEVILSYDSDNAGVLAAKRAIGILKDVGLRGRVLNLSPHKDPDEFIKTEGKEAFAERLKQAESTYFFELRVAERDYDMEDPEGRTLFIRDAARRLCEFEEPIERENYLEATARRYQVSAQDLKQLVADTAAKLGQERPTVRAARPVRTQEVRNAEEEMRKLKPQRMLLTWLTDEPSLLSVVERYVKAEDFTDPLYRTVAERVYADIRGGTLQPAVILQGFPEEDQGKVAAIFDTPMEYVTTQAERQKALEALIRDVRKRKLEQQLAALDESGQGSFAERVALKKQMEELKRFTVKW